MLSIGFSLFLSGLFLGSGPCLISCGPFLVSFIAGNKKDFKQSLWIWLVFSLSRIFAYLILGILVGLFSQAILSSIYQKAILRYLFILAGFFVALIGILMLFDRLPKLKLCESLKKTFIQKSTKSMILFGLLVGFLPCVPLLGILTYVVLISKDVLKSVFYCFSFGLGTLVSPLIIMAVCASFIYKLLGSQERVYYIFSKICAVIILLLGLQLAYKGFNI